MLVVAQQVGFRQSCDVSPPEVKKAEWARTIWNHGEVPIVPADSARKRAGDGARTHDSHVGNVALYH